MGKTVLVQGGGGEVVWQTEVEEVASLGDHALVECARTGNREAFGELVRRHRERALGWAFSVAQDGQLAEDIVQEALLRAFLKMETLLAPDRFQAWLQRIVRNQANMMLRRGGPHGPEKPFSELETRHKGESGGGVSDLDRLLFRITSHIDEERHHNEDPQRRLLRKELFISLHQLLRCLSPKEREVFEAHVFHQLPPAEIARLFGTTLGSVYTTISRARTKVQRERIHVYFQGYAQDKKQAGCKSRQVLQPPIPFIVVRR